MERDTLAIHSRRVYSSQALGEVSYTLVYDFDIKICIREKLG